MATWLLSFFARLRVGFLPAALSLALAACGQVGVSGSGSPLDSTADGIGGGGTSGSSSAPLISGKPQAIVVAGQAYAFTPTASRAAGKALTYSIANKPDWASFDASSGELSGTPPLSSVGTFANVEISASDGQTTATLPAFSIEVVAPLTISGDPVTAIATGARYSFQPTTSAPTGTTLTFSIQNAPPWGGFNPSTGELAGVASQTGTFSGIVIAVTDGAQTSALPAFSITVSAANGNTAPTIFGHPATGVVAGAFYSFTPTASDPNGGSLTFTIQNRPAWARFDPSTGTLSGSPSATQTGLYSNIVISVSNGAHSASLAPFSISVEAPLTIAGHPTTEVGAGSSYMFKPTTDAPTGTALTFAIQNRPIWASFSSATGTLSGTPGGNQVGTDADIVISVSDGIQSVALPAFSIKVLGQLQISGSPPTQAAPGRNYAFQPKTNAARGTELRFSIENKPAWASFSAASGLLSGTPSSRQTGTYRNIAIKVSDGMRSAALAAFSVTVTGSSGGPTISGNPLSAVNVDSPYSFTPAASDPGGGPLTFSIQNQPGWASFSPSTGTLSGTPGAGDAGSYTNIVISVSDGSASASLPAFSITVNQVSSGSATLVWTPVTKNTNGSTLTDLAGYKVHYGTAATAMTTVVTLANPSVTNYLVTNLSSGTWYFGITAYASDGTESSLSNVGRTIIP